MNPEHSDIPIIKLDRVAFTYPNTENSASRVILDAVSLQIRQGAFVLVKGPSGSGKSTFLRLLCRLEEPDSGSIRFQNRPVREIPPPELRRQIRHVQQVPTLTTDSVRDNLLLPFNFRVNRDKVPPSDDMLKRLLVRYSLPDIGLDHPAGNLSVGQRQRLCLIRAALTDPRVLLLDEPTSALDETSAAVVMEQTERMCRGRGMTIIMATHALEPLNTETMVLHLHNGHLEERSKRST